MKFTIDFSKLSPNQRSIIATMIQLELITQAGYLKDDISQYPEGHAKTQLMGWEKASRDLQQELGTFVREQKKAGLWDKAEPNGPDPQAQASKPQAQAEAPDAPTVA
jgi:hypothetical protein